MSATPPGRPGPAAGTQPQQSADGRWWWDGHRWVPRQEPTPGAGSSGWWWAVSALLVVVVGGTALLGVLQGDDTSEAAASQGPESERELIAVVSDAQDELESGEPEDASEIRRRRTERLCELLPPDKAVADWVGTVVDVEPDVEGQGGALTVRLSFGIEVATTRNTFSALGEQTLIRKDEPLYDTLTDLEVGDDVTFSGQFLADEQNCIEDFSVTPEGSVEAPSFFFDFSALTAG